MKDVPPFHYYDGNNAMKHTWKTWMKEAAYCIYINFSMNRKMF